MGGVVRSVKKAVKKVTSAVRKGVGGLVGGHDAPDVYMPEAPEPTAPSAAAAPSVAPTGPTADTEAGISDAAAKRRGKRSVTIGRTKAGSGQGLNV